MTNIEAKLAVSLHTPTEEQADTSSTTANLLTLLTALQAEPLTTSQQTIVSQLQCRFLSLAESLNTEPMLLNQVVNEQQAEPQHQWRRGCSSSSAGNVGNWDVPVIHISSRP